MKYSDIQNSLKKIESDHKFSKESPLPSNPLFVTDGQILKFNNFGMLH